MFSSSPSISAFVIMTASPASAVFFGSQTFRTTVTVTNPAPATGTCVTPLWFGIHDGTFDTYNRDQALPGFMEGIVEDGNPADLVAEFGTAAGGVVDGVVLNSDNSPPVFCPGATDSYSVEHEVGGQLFFSYASMVIPSNDAFVANGDPTAFEIFNGFRFPVGATIMVPGTSVLDGGTEVNDEVPGNTAGLSQPMAGMVGTDEGGVVTLHPGFLTGDNILAANPGATFLDDGYMVLTVAVESELIDEGISGFLGRLWISVLGIFF